MIWQINARRICCTLAIVALAGCHDKQPPKVIHHGSAASERIAQLGPWQVRYESEREAFLQRSNLTTAKVPERFSDPSLKQIYQSSYREGFIQASSPEGLQKLAGNWEPPPLSDDESSARWYGWDAGRQAGLAEGAAWIRAELDAYEQAARPAN